MSNPTFLTISPGHPMSFRVVVTKNSIDPVTGVNTPTLDMTSALTFPSNNHPEAVVPSVDASDNRLVHATAGVLPAGTADIGWTFTVGCTSVTGPVVSAAGKTQTPADISNVSWDGVAPTSP
jgi:hypothetical protein